MMLLNFSYKHKVLHITIFFHNSIESSDYNSEILLLTFAWNKDFSMAIRERDKRLFPHLMIRDCMFTCLLMYT